MRQAQQVSQIKQELTVPDPFKIRHLQKNWFSHWESLLQTVIYGQLIRQISREDHGWHCWTWWWRMEMGESRTVENRNGTKIHLMCNNSINGIWNLPTGREPERGGKHNYQDIYSSYIPSSDIFAFGSLGPATHTSDVFLTGRFSLSYVNNTEQRKSYQIIRHTIYSEAYRRHLWVTWNSKDRLNEEKLLKCSDEASSKLFQGSITCS